MALASIPNPVGPGNDRVNTRAGQLASQTNVYGAGLGCVTRIGIGCVFMGTGVMKLAMLGSRVPPHLIVDQRVLSVIGVAECLLALALCLSRRTWVLVVAAVAAGAMCAATVVMIYYGVDTRMCGCFGRHHVSNAARLVLAGGLLILSVLAVHTERMAPGSGRSQLNT